MLAISLMQKLNTQQLLISQIKCITNIQHFVLKKDSLHTVYVLNNLCIYENLFIFLKFELRICCKYLTKPYTTTKSSLNNLNYIKGF